MSNVLLHAQFTTGTPAVGKTGLTVTADVDKVARADGTRTVVATDAACTEGRNGLYYYLLASADLQTYDYPATFKTADSSVNAQHVPALRSDYSDVPGGMTAQGYTSAKTGFALTTGERDSIADAILDRANGVETSFTPRQALRLFLAALAGKLSISGNTVTIRDVNDAKNRITATTDADGQRTAVTTDVS